MHKTLFESSDQQTVRLDISKESKATQKIYSFIEHISLDYFVFEI